MSLPLPPSLRVVGAQYSLWGREHQQMHVSNVQKRRVEESRIQQITPSLSVLCSLLFLATSHACLLLLAVATRLSALSSCVRCTARIDQQPTTTPRREGKTRKRTPFRPQHQTSTVPRCVLQQRRVFRKLQCSTDAPVAHGNEKSSLMRIHSSRRLCTVNTSQILQIYTPQETVKIDWLRMATRAVCRQQREQEY